MEAILGIFMFLFMLVAYIAIFIGAFALYFSLYFSLSLFIYFVAYLMSLPFYIPYFIYARKHNGKHAWLAFVPVFNLFPVFSTFRNKFPVIGNFSLSSGTKAFWMYTGIYVAYMLIGVPVIVILSLLSLGLLYLPLLAVSCVIAWTLPFALFRNMADRHFGEKPTNAVIALGILLLNQFVTGWTIPLYLLILAFMPAVENEDAVIAETADVVEEIPAAVAE